MSSRNISREELLIDGYVSHTFGPQDAEAYFSALLMSRPQHIQWQIIPPEGIFYAAAPPCLDSNQDDQEAWAIDRAIKHTGRVIPQHIWTPRLSPDVQRYVRHETLRPPILFIHEDGGSLGLSLREAAAGNCMCIRGAEQAARVGPSNHVQLRINWCGYRHLDWSDQIMTSFHKVSLRRETVSLGKFAKYAAGRVLKFMETAKFQPYRDDFHSDQQHWLIADHHITPRHVILIGVVQVSQGSWMPILQLNDSFSIVL